MPLAEMNTMELRNELVKLTSTMSRRMLMAILTLLESKEAGKSAMVQEHSVWPGDDVRHYDGVFVPLTRDEIYDRM